MKKLLGVLAVAACIPVLHAGVYNFSTLHQGTTPTVGHDSALGVEPNRDSDAGPGDGPIAFVVPTPEPGFYGLMAVGFGALVIFHVRRRRHA